MGIQKFQKWFLSQFPNAIETTKIRSSKPKKLYDHVLIDLNSLLHQSVRRGRNEDHALGLFINSLRKQLMTIARPKKSVVLAFDGPPPAAKFEEQRQRRMNALHKSERKQQRLDWLRDRGIEKVIDTNKTKRKRSSSLANEKERLKITPGTEFMEKAHDSILYWAYGSLSKQGRLSNCNIYISTSSMGGEGEVKLLGWLHQASKEKPKLVKADESIAIVGGDSDLIMGCLTLERKIIENTYMILPVDAVTNHILSLKDVVETLTKHMGENIRGNGIKRLQTDFILLSIMHGNDYLPSLRGVGIEVLFDAYQELVKKWCREHTDQQATMSLVNSDSLEFNIPFCIEYFSILSKRHRNVESNQIPQNSTSDSFAVTLLSQMYSLYAAPYLPLTQKSRTEAFIATPLSQMYSLHDAGYLPSPIIFEEVTKKCGESYALRLKCGKEPSQKDSRHETMTNSNRFNRYEICLPSTHVNLQVYKQILADMVLKDLLGDDYSEFTNFFQPQHENGIEYIENTKSRKRAQSSVADYLKGLLWNLSTLKKGFCSDYSYNYGSRRSPTAQEILAYFETIQAGEKISPKNSQILPLSAAMCSLLLLPPPVNHLIPQPLRKLSIDGIADDMYYKCVDPETKVFDLRGFEYLCKEAINDDKEVLDESEISKTYATAFKEMKLSKKCWTVLRKWVRSSSKKNHGTVPLRYNVLYHPYRVRTQVP